MTKYNKDSSYDTCPECGEQMEHGYIVGLSHLSWCDHVPLMTCKCGDRFDRALIGCANLEGFRCKNCQIIRYMKKK